MVTTVSGPLHLVSDNPADVTEVWVSAPRPRLHGDGVVLAEIDNSPTIVAGVLSFEAVPGPITITPVLAGGVPLEALRGTVPDSATATLREVLQGGEVWTPEEVSMFARLKADAESAAQRAETAADSAEWDGPYLTVAGKTSPDLTGPQGEKGDKGDASVLATLVEEVAPDSGLYTVRREDTEIDTVTPQQLEDGLDGKADTGHKHPATDITDSTAVGRAVVTAVDAAAARAAIGAGTSDLELGTTSVTAKAGDYQPTWGQVQDKPTEFTPEEHRHPWDELDDVPTTFPPEGHEHTTEQVTGLDDALNSKANGEGITLWAGTQAEYDALPTATKQAVGFVAVIHP